MSDTRQMDNFYHFLYDPAIFGYTTDGFFKTMTGVPAISGGKLRLNAAATTTIDQYMFGEVEFLITIPVAPVAGQSKIFGFKSQAEPTSNYAYFSIAEDIFTVASCGDWGKSSQTTTLTWLAAWTNAAIRMKIVWYKDKVVFLIDDVVVATHNATYLSAAISYGIPEMTLPLYFSNGNADNVDITWVEMKGMRVTSGMGNNLSLTLGDINVNVEGNVAHDAVDAGNPLKIGGKASTAKPAAVSDGDRVNAYFDVYGRMHVYDEGGGGVGGGGFSLYNFTPGNTVGHGVTAYASGTTLTVKGHAFSPEAQLCVKIEQYNVSGALLNIYTPQQNTVTATTSSGTTTYNVAGATFGATDTFVVYQQGPERTVDVGGDTQKVAETNSVTFQFTEDILVNTTNLAGAPTTYYYELIPGNRNGQLSIDIGVSGGVTVTVEASNDSGAAPTYRDITYAGANMLYNGAGVPLNASSYVDTNALLMYPGLAVYRVRVKVVCADGSNAVFIATKLTSI